MTIEIHIGEAPLIAEQITVPGCGSAVTFSGIVRGEENGAAIEGLYYEAYEPMARRVMHDLLSELAHAHPCERVRVAHRIGWVPVGEAAIIVQVYSPHRQEGFALLAAFMDRLKQDVPIWKQSTGARASCSRKPTRPGRSRSRRSRSLQSMIEIETLWALIDREVIKGAWAASPPAAACKMRAHLSRLAQSPAALGKERHPTNRRPQGKPRLGPQAGSRAGWARQFASEARLTERAANQ